MNNVKVLFSIFFLFLAGACLPDEPQSTSSSVEARGFKEIFGIEPNDSFHKLHYYHSQGFSDSLSLLRFSYRNVSDIEDLINEVGFQEVPLNKMGGMTGDFPEWWEESLIWPYLWKEKYKAPKVLGYIQDPPGEEVIYLWVIKEKMLVLAQRVHH